MNQSIVTRSDADFLCAQTVVAYSYVNTYHDYARTHAHVTAMAKLMRLAKKKEQEVQQHFNSQPSALLMDKLLSIIVAYLIRSSSMIISIIISSPLLFDAKARHSIPHIRINTT